MRREVWRLDFIARIVRGCIGYCRNKTKGGKLDINGRFGLAVLSWFVLAAVASFLIGGERKKRWFKLRDPSKGFLNRRGFLGDFMNFGYPRTIQGWAVLSAFALLIVVTSYIAVYCDSI